MDRLPPLDGLNEAQRQAVLHGAGPVLVVAGAGSGKTRVLTLRIAHLVAQGVPAWRILAVTFTNKAAREMQERVLGIVGEAARDLWVLTFHAACLRILRAHAPLVGLPPRFTVLDADDQRAVVRAALRTLGLDERSYAPGAVASLISRWKNDGLDAEAASAEAGDPFRKAAARVYRRYAERLSEAGAVDFDDLLLLTLRLFEAHPDVRARLAERFLHVLVDEYQDTNPAQYRIVRALAERHQNLFVVGDADQSIYGWRGADIRNILEFERDFPDARVIRLEQNYRSTQAILDAAASVIRHNLERRERELWSELGPGEPVRFFCAWDDRAEAEFVADEIGRLIREGGRSASDFAVLYRTHAQSRAFEEAFLLRGLPYQVVGGLKFYERREIKDVLAYLRLVENPYDVVSFERIANVPRRGLGPRTIARLLAARGEGSIVDALLRADAVAGLGGRQKVALRELGELLAELAELAQRLGVAELVEEVLRRTRYREELRAEASPQDLSRLENLEELVNVARAFPARTDGSHLGDFLAEAALVSEADSHDPGRPAVSLMTLHTAKGLEFPVVFLVGLEERTFPHARSLEEGNLEEERRLCYVGMTRAKERLYLTMARRRALYGGLDWREPSRFLAEVGKERLHPVGGGALWGEDADGSPGAALGARQSDFAGRSDPSERNREWRSWAPGDRVRHALWGPGTVVAVTGEAGDAEVTVAFQGVGLRRLLVRYARLEPA
ncbi:MAG: UvrD-helicase domain-containing protein [Clostridia bacterium]|nr:UvrD-helicase domain-containing protein [Clostridia bacterium]